MEYPRGTINELNFKSAVLGEHIQILIYLPANFSPLYKYSLLFVQDGQDYFQLGRIASLTDELLYEKKIENVIIVGLPYKDPADRRNKYHPSGEDHEAYVRFLAHELVPYMDREFPTYQMGSTRTLIGDSLAATVSLLTSLAYPHTFGKAIIQSPYVNETVLKAAEEYNINLPLTIYHVIGQKETNVETTIGKTADFLKPNRQLSGILQKKQFIYHYEEYNGDHTWTYWQPDLRKALTHMF